MKNRRHTPTATSLPQAPEDEAASRLKRYAITMGIRTACFILMAVITPYGWYTWVFAAGAIFLPYVAVVYANAGESTVKTSRAQSPSREIDAPVSAPEPIAEAPDVITLNETPARDRDKKS